MRVVIAEDSVLLREGLVALLREHEVEVVAEAEDGEGLLRIVGGHKPDLAIVDVRMPPSYTDEGLRAAIEARRRVPGTSACSSSASTSSASTRPSCWQTARAVSATC